MSRSLRRGRKYPVKGQDAKEFCVAGFYEPIDEPVVFSWMPAASVFSDDPDSNLLEYIVMLDDEPQPELGLLLSWSEWLSGRKKAK